MIRGIIFDCYGVLVHGSLGYLRMLTPAGARGEFDDLVRASDRGMISQPEYVNGVAGLIGRDSAEVEATIRQQEVKSREMLDFVASLRGEYKTAMLSNVGRGSMERLFTRAERNALFDAIVLSSEIGVVKPSAGAYQITADKLGLLPDECVMIDDRAVNVHGAIDAGMQGIVFEDLDQCKDELENLTEKRNA